MLHRPRRQGAQRGLVWPSHRWKQLVSRRVRARPAGRSHRAGAGAGSPDDHAASPLVSPAVLLIAHCGDALRSAFWAIMTGPLSSTLWSLNRWFMLQTLSLDPSHPSRPSNEGMLEIEVALKAAEPTWSRREQRRERRHGERDSRHPLDGSAQLHDATPQQPCRRQQNSGESQPTEQRNSRAHQSLRAELSTRAEAHSPAAWSQEQSRQRRAVHEGTCSADADSEQSPRHRARHAAQQPSSGSPADDIRRQQCPRADLAPAADTGPASMQPSRRQQISATSRQDSTQRRRGNGHGSLHGTA